MLNAALELHDEKFEIIEGVKIMSPSPSVNHNLIAMRLAHTFINQLIIKNSKGYILTEIDVHFPDGNLFKPDLIAISFDNKKIMQRHGTIHGVPDMTVEIFSRSTRKRDVTIKKNIYEANGVKEYWTIDPFAKTVEIFTLHDGKFDDGTEYIYYEEEEWNDLTEDERQNSPQEIPSTIFEGLTVKLSDVFGWYI